MKVAVYGIAKNELQNVDKFIDSCRDADGVFIGVDDGDETGPALRRAGAHVVIIKSPFRFDRHRNFVLDCIPEDYDICVSLDLDETLSKGWRRELERAWIPGTTRVHYWMQSAGSQRFIYDRIHARHGYRWKYATHECVIATNTLIEKCEMTQISVIHQQDDLKDRSKNLPLLQLAVQEEPSSLRMNWYLGREYLMEGYLHDSRETFDDYFSLRPTWRAENCWARIFVSRTYSNDDMKNDAEAWLHSAIAVCSDLRDPYFELAQLYQGQMRYREAINMIDTMLNIKNNLHNFFQSNNAYSEWPYILKARMYHDLGDVFKHREALNAAIRINPNSVDVLNEIK